MDAYSTAPPPFTRRACSRASLTDRSSKGTTRALRALTAAASAACCGVCGSAASAPPKLPLPALAAHAARTWVSGSNALRRVSMHVRTTSSSRGRCPIRCTTTSTRTDAAAAAAATTSAVPLSEQFGLGAPPATEAAAMPQLVAGRTPPATGGGGGSASPSFAAIAVSGRKIAGQRAVSTLGRSITTSIASEDRCHMHSLASTLACSSPTTSGCGQKRVRSTMRVAGPYRGVSCSMTSVLEVPAGTGTAIVRSVSDCVQRYPSAVPASGSTRFSFVCRGFSGGRSGSGGGHCPNLSGSPAALAAAAWLASAAIISLRGRSGMAPRCGSTLTSSCLKPSGSRSSLRTSASSSSRFRV
eukprot:scaffold223306_cov31-Tisochrysis_lutea.AAC.1